jgi:sporulation protein YlmC with PRC-barrel domain
VLTYGQEFQKEGAMYITEIIGKMVIDKNANTVGKVVDANVTFPGWEVKHLLVKIGFIKKLNIEIDKVDKMGDKIILNVAKNELLKVML